MSTQIPRTDGIHVLLLRPGVGKSEIHLPVGSTLVDLLTLAEAQTVGRLVLVDPRPLEEAVVLESGMVVSVVPQPTNSGSETWRDTIGMFRDDPTFQEMVDAGKAYRETDREVTPREDPDESV